MDSYQVIIELPSQSVEMRYFAFPADIQIFLLFFSFLMKKLSLCWAFVFFLMDWLPAAQA